ncbi:hypothetical protein VTI28DRAFT_9487 [Corynascus sepedonium]
MARSAPLPRLLASVLLLTVSVLTPPVHADDDEVGYYMSTRGDDVTAVTASCQMNTEWEERWSTVDNMGVCAATSDLQPASDSTSVTHTTTMTYFYLGDRCDGVSASGHLIGRADSLSVTVTLDFSCYDECATITIYEASPSASPSVSFIGCPELLGLPPEARTVYRQFPSSTSTEPSSATSTAPSTQSSDDSEPEETGSSNSNDDNGDSGEDDSTGGGPNVPVIVGAVVGSIGGVALISLAFVLGWRYAGKNRSTPTDPTPHNSQSLYGGQPKLDQMGPGAGTGTPYVDPNNAAQHAAWAQQYPYQQQYQQSTVSPSSGHWSYYPVAQQPPATEGGLYEAPGSHEFHHEAPGQDVPAATQLGGYQQYPPPHTQT